MLDLCKILGCAILALSLFSCLSQAKPKHHRHRGHRHHGHRGNPCPSGWTNYDDSCYKHFVDALSWRDAAANCARHNAHLVIINSDDEADWLCTRLSLLSVQQWNLCRAWWTAGASDDGSWVWRQPGSVYETIIRSDKWFGGRPDAHSLDGYRVTMQLANGYFGLIARDPDTRLPSICEKEVEDSDSSDSSSDSSTRSHGSHSRGSGSRDRDSHGHHSRGSGSSDSDRSHGHGHHSRGSHSHESHGHGHHHRGRGGHHSRGGHSSRYGHIHGQYPRYRQNPYSPYYPRPRLPDTCEQPETTTTTTTETTTTPCITHPTTTTISTTEEPTTTEKPTTAPTTAAPTTTERPTTTEEPTTTEKRTTTEEPTTAVISTERPEPCPPGWLSYSTSCYQIHNSCAQTRYIARTACELLGGHLVTINTPEEEEFLTSKLDKRKEWWISGRCEDGDWSFEDGSDSSSSSSSGDYDYFLVISRRPDEQYTNWHQNEPSRNEDGTFAVLSWSKGHWGWRSRPGYEYKNFICEVDKDKVKYGCLTTACQYNIEGNQEINDWEKFLDNEYLVHDSCAKTQSDAATTCKQKGGQLLSIKSSAEMRFVQRLLRTRSYDMEDAPNWWTCGIKSLGKWQWEDTKKKFIYTNWGPDVDIPGGNYMVLHYYPFYDEWMWTDTKKSQVLPFICKRAA